MAELKKLNMYLWKLKDGLLKNEDIPIFIDCEQTANSHGTQGKNLRSLKD